MHIGMIGGIGPAATSFYYQNLVKIFASANEKLELTIVHAEANELINNIATNSSMKQAEIFLKLADRLKVAGAEVIVISSIAGHFCLSEFEKLSPLPVVSIVKALELEFKKRQLRCVGLLGSRIAMESKLYGGISSVDVVVPIGQDLVAVHTEYIKMATSGVVNQDQRELLFAIGKSLCKNQGAEIIVLAGTDLFLAFDGYDCGFNTIDSALVHVEALCRMSAKYCITFPAC